MRIFILLVSVTYVKGSDYAAVAAKISVAFAGVRNAKVTAIIKEKPMDAPSLHPRVGIK
jgi:hypothetical protein